LREADAEPFSRDYDGTQIERPALTVPEKIRFQMRKLP
jgi:hypothetical protein